MADMLSPIAENVKALRRLRALTQQQLCDRVNSLDRERTNRLSRRKLTEIESGVPSRARTKRRTVELMAEALETSVDALTKRRMEYPDGGCADIQLTAFGHPVPDISLEGAFFTWPGGYKRSMIRCELVGEFRRHYPPQLKKIARSLRELETDFMRQRRESAKANSARFSNDPSYGIVSVRPDRSYVPRERKRITPYEFELVKTTYYNFLWPNLVLDESVKIVESATTLRSVFDLTDPRTEDIPEKPFISFRIGTGTVLVTSDGFAVVPLRTRRNEIAPSGYHASLAEGMLIEDVNSSGKPCPFETCYRAFRSELGLTRGQDYLDEDVTCLAFLFDQKRCQPFFSFFLRSEAVSFDDVVDRWRSAEDRSENQGLVKLKWNRANARQLVAGRISIRRFVMGREQRTATQDVEAASNHAQANFAVAARFSFPGFA